MMSTQQDARQKTPEEVVQQQVEAYNKHDIEAFLATYSPNVEITERLGAQVSITGHTAMRGIWGPLFENFPALHATITNRMVLGNFVIDYEEATGIPDIGVLHAIAIYEVNDGVIQKVWFIGVELPKG
jgi:hypothetical protein